MTDDKQQLTPLQESWVEALESGDYTQTTGQLRRTPIAGEILGVAVTIEEAFCCLGVACDLLPDTSWDGDDTDNAYPSATADLPKAVRQAFGFRTSSGVFTLDGDNKSLVGMNDEDKLSFAEIAEFVREHPDLIFLSADEMEATYGNV